MFEFITADQNIPFAVVLVLLVAFFLIELASLLFGGSLTGLLGEVDLPDFDMDLDIDLDFGVATKFLYWLKIGKVPLMVLIVIFMAAFVLSGLALQLACLWLTGGLLPGWLAALGALFLSVPVVRVTGRFVTRVIPKDETDAISRAELVGGRAVIVIGTARRGSPAQAKTVDRHGTTHYIMVEPDDSGEEFGAGRDLLLVRQDETRFYAIAHPNP